MQKHLLLLFSFITMTVSAQQAPFKKLIKLPFAFSAEGRSPMENTPIQFLNRTLIVANHRPGGFESKGEDAYLYIEDLQTGEELARFGQGHSFVSAFVEGNELHIFALEFANFGRIINTSGIDHFVTKDLKEWKLLPKAIKEEGAEHLFNNSVSKDDQGYIMAYESDKPVQFCFKFARSKNLTDWTKVPEVVFTGEKKEYSACPVIRYHAPYYYVIFLHAPVDGHKGYLSYMIRSKDLTKWEYSPFNPILEASEGEGVNNSDVDLIELDGRTYIYYATGDQESWGTIRVAMYDGPEQHFFEQYFPANTPLQSTMAK